MLSARCKTLSP